LEPETLESRSRALKTRIIAQNEIKPRATKSAAWVGSQGTMTLSKKRKTYPNYDLTDKK